MANRLTLSLRGALPFLAAMAFAESPAPVPTPAPAAQDSSPAAAPKPAFGDAFIAQGLLRVHLDRPAIITVYNARGQQVFKAESQRSLESVPLHGLTTGFIYLTVRSGTVEMTKKLVYTGK